MKLRLLCVGKLKKGPEQALCERYLERLPYRPDVVVLPDAPGKGDARKNRESAELLAKVRPSDRLIALDEGGEALTSPAFAELLSEAQRSAEALCFVIGGAYGLSQALCARADRLLALGAVTWPHGLVRALLFEQLYRAHCLSSGHPYHKA